MNAHTGRLARGLPASLSAIEPGHDLPDLVELFGRIEDPKNRRALVAIARLLAAPPAAPLQND